MFFCYSVYIFAHTFQNWNLATTLDVARAYSSGIVHTNGELWISGGASIDKILDSIEIIKLLDDEQWKVRRGPKLKRSLIGHCFASLSNHEIIVAGGYSPDLDDFSDEVAIYDMKSSIWISKPWMALKNYGPRMDATCFNFLIGSQQSVFMVGGWNNSFMNTSEYFDRSTLAWKLLEESKNLNESDNIIFPNGIRSAAVVEVNNKFHILGGVQCYR